MTLVAIERRGETAVIRFQRPPVNAFNLPFVEEFHQRLEELAVDVPASGLVVTGEGPIFSGGVDFKEVPRYEAEERTRMVGHINAAVTLLYGLRTATVVPLNGSAIGGALVVGLACDMRVAADREATLALTEVTAGIPYPACPMEVVKAEIEPSCRRRLVMTGEGMDPRTAEAHGLVDEVVAPGDLLRRAVELAELRAAAPSYARVKDQLKGEALSRMREVLVSGGDPMLEHWV